MAALPLRSAANFLGEERPYVYITMLRKPFQGWRRGSPTATNIRGTSATPRPTRSAAVAKWLNFYQARKRKYDSIEPSKLDTARNAPVINAQTFHPNWLESLSDIQLPVAKIYSAQFC